MRTLIGITTIVLVALSLAACQSTRPARDNSPTDAASFAQGRTVAMIVNGMTCPFCASNLEEYLIKIDGVERTTANLGTGRVLVQVASFGSGTEATLRKAVDESGFTVDQFDAPGGAQ
ncbi:hypothetical protein MNBD_PLANCTO03-684 [hydrothermal vent metagenome]|uniref:HMA domain-containing protein n=1 Tax=hydrothermal vent metagenome TaxID=652676 RepID=A0A3B1E023_9ZZZZ